MMQLLMLPSTSVLACRRMRAPGWRLRERMRLMLRVPVTRRRRRLGRSRGLGVGSVGSSGVAERGRRLVSLRRWRVGLLLLIAVRAVACGSE